MKLNVEPTEKNKINKKITCGDFWMRVVPKTIGSAKNTLGLFLTGFLRQPRPSSFKWPSVRLTDRQRQRHAIGRSLRCQVQREVCHSEWRFRTSAEKHSVTSSTQNLLPLTKKDLVPNSMTPMSKEIPIRTVYAWEFNAGITVERFL